MTRSWLNFHAAGCALAAALEIAPLPASAQQSAAPQQSSVQQQSAAPLPSSAQQQSAPQQQSVVSAPGASARTSRLPRLTALPTDYFATTPHLFGEWPSIRSQLSDLEIDVSLTGVDEAVLNLSGGERRIAQEAGLALQAKFDLQKRLGLQGASVLLTLVDRWGRDAATDAGIPALQRINEVYGRGNIVRLEEFAWDQKLFDDRIETTIGRLAFGDEFLGFLAISSI